nr:MAG TPA: hypothetical protein [Caudoviricetes sp.]
MPKFSQHQRYTGHTRRYAKRKETEMWESPIRQLPLKVEKEEVGEDLFMYGRVDKSQLTAQELREHAAYIEGMNQDAISLYVNVNGLSDEEATQKYLEALAKVRAERSDREGLGE